MKVILNLLPLYSVLFCRDIVDTYTSIVNLLLDKVSYDTISSQHIEVASTDAVMSAIQQLVSLLITLLNENIEFYVHNDDNNNNESEATADKSGFINILSILSIIQTIMVFFPLTMSSQNNASLILKECITLINIFSDDMKDTDRYSDIEREIYSTLIKLLHYTNSNKEGVECHQMEETLLFDIVIDKLNRMIDKEDFIMTNDMINLFHQLISFTSMEHLQSSISIIIKISIKLIDGIDNDIHRQDPTTLVNNDSNNFRYDKLKITELENERYKEIFSILVTLGTLLRT